MLQWKQRLYAFLLRRALGPWLDEPSLRQLHRSIEVSLQEGKFVLRDVGLNVEFLTSKLLRQRRKRRRSGGGDDGVSEAAAAAACLEIRAARVERLEIHLSLVEEQQQYDDDDDSAEGGGDNRRPPPSSLAWRAIQLGSTPAATSASSASPVVSLVARIEVDGVVVEVVPCSDEVIVVEDLDFDTDRGISSAASPGDVPDPSSESDASTTKGRLASYLEAALASLRLSLLLKNLTVRISDDGRYDGEPANNKHADQMDGIVRWVEVGIGSASYRDNTMIHNSATAIISPLTDTTTIQPETILNKTLDLHQVTLRTGELLKNCPEERRRDRLTTTVALLDGATQVTLRVVEDYGKEGAFHMSTSPPMSATRQQQEQPRHIQHDVQVNLDRLNLSLDVESLMRMQFIVDCYRRHSEKVSFTTATPTKNSAVEERMTAQVLERNELLQDKVWDPADEADLRAMDGIMKQYREARLLAEQNYFRNGIMLPSDDAVIDGQEPTFDCFFDANDESFAHYSTVLRESVLSVGRGGLDSDSGHTKVHTKVRVHLHQGSFKLWFPRSERVVDSCTDIGGDDEISRLRNCSVRSDEYILLTFSEAQANSSIARENTEHSLTITQLDVEDSQVIEDTRASGGVKEGFLRKRVEIGSLLQFAAQPNHRRGGEVLVQPPCLTLYVKMGRCRECVIGSDETSSNTEADLSFEPIELTYRQRTMANLFALLGSLQTGCSSGLDADDNDDFENCTGDANAFTAVKCDTEQKSNRELSLYVSCSSLVLTLPALFEYDWSPLYQRCGYSTDSSLNRRSSLGLSFDSICFQSINSVKDTMTASLECNHITAYAVSPSSGSNLMFDRKSRRFDVLSLSGINEGDPCIPISVKLWRDSNDRSEKRNMNPCMFPTVPAISSFKARQEDDDDDNRIDRVLSSKLYGDAYMNTSRRDLRSNDPQTEMMLEASKCDRGVSIRIPEAMIDCSVDELRSVCHMLEVAIGIPASREVARHQQDKFTDSSAPQLRSCVAFECDFLSLVVHGGEQERPPGPEQPNATFIAHFDKLKAHVLRDGLSARQARILSHEFDLYHGK